MNIEIENIKKIIDVMRKDIDFLKNSIINKDTRQHFEINLSYTDNKIFDKDLFTRLLVSRIPIDKISFKTSYSIDSKYLSNLFPDLKMYNNNITIFIITKNAILPESFKNNISKIINHEFIVKNYKNSDDFNERTSSIQDLLPYNINSMIIY